jgi:hypothetical protein
MERSGAARPGALLVTLDVSACPIADLSLRSLLESGDTSLSRYHDVTVRQTTVRFPDELADQAEAVARVRGISVNALVVDALTAEIARARGDGEFTKRARALLEHDERLWRHLLG